MGPRKGTLKTAALTKGIENANKPGAPSTNVELASAPPIGHDQEEYLLSLLKPYFGKVGAARRVSTEDFGVYDLRYVHRCKVPCKRILCTCEDASNMKLQQYA